MLRKFIKFTGRKIRNIARTGKRRSLAIVIGKGTRDEEEGISISQVASKNRDETQPDSHKDIEGTKEKRSPPGRNKKKIRWKVSHFVVEPVSGEVRFHDLNLTNAIMHGIADVGFKYCTPVQAKALPELLEGKDLIGRASTGTGKSAVFLISIFSRLLQEDQQTYVKGKRKGKPRALILAPTRELVMQLAKDGQQLAKYTPLRIAAVYGGTDYEKQMRYLTEKRCDVVAATPGRLLDFLGKNIIQLDECDILVIDEADRMLDMGFIPDVRRIIYRLGEKKQRQTMLFSATITEEVQRLAAQWCTDPVLVETEPEQVAVETVDQIVYLVTSAEKYTVLYNLIQKMVQQRIIIFVNQKRDARRLRDRLQRNSIHCTLLSGDVSQNKRMNRLEEFRAGKVKVLVATDVAGRGIHIEGISHVVNYTLPYEPEDYVHRIGRTGRAGTLGTSISFACEEGAFYLPEIEEFIGEKLECVSPDEELLEKPPKGVEPKRNSGKSNYRKPKRSNRPYKGKKRTGKYTGKHVAEK